MTGNESNIRSEKIRPDQTNIYIYVSTLPSPILNCPNVKCSVVYLFIVLFFTAACVVSAMAKTVGKAKAKATPMKAMKAKKPMKVHGQTATSPCWNWKHICQKHVHFHITHTTYHSTVNTVCDIRNTRHDGLHGLHGPWSLYSPVVSRDRCICRQLTIDSLNF